MKRLITVLLTVCVLFTACGTMPDKTDGPAPPKSAEIPDGKGNDFDFYASGDYIYRNNGGKSELFYIRGVNMGLTEPTTDLSNPNTAYSTYYR